MAEITCDLSKGIYRRIYAGFIRGRRINSISLEAEAWFWRLNAIADDYGNLEAESEHLWAMTKGKRSVEVADVERMVSEMAAAGLIQTYSAGGERFIHIVGFEEMQPAGRNGKRVKRVAFQCESGEDKGNPRESQIILGNPRESGNSQHSISIPNCISIPTPIPTDAFASNARGNINDSFPDQKRADAIELLGRINGRKPK